MIRTFYGWDEKGEWSPYLTRVSLTPMTRWGQLLLHVFHRRDADPDCHDHPWDFWTFPLVSYYETHLLVPTRAAVMYEVKRFRWHFRPAEHAHRVEGHGSGDGRKVVTLVWRKKDRRDWGFWVENGLKPPRWVPWKDYLKIT